MCKEFSWTRLCAHNTLQRVLLSRPLPTHRTQGENHLKKDAGMKKNTFRYNFCIHHAEQAPSLLDSALLIANFLQRHSFWGINTHLGKMLVGGHKLRKQMHCDCHKMKTKPSEHSIPCRAVAAACVCHQGHTCWCGRSTRAAPRLLFGLQRKRMCSVWCLLLSADGRRKFLPEVQRLLLKGKEMLLVALRKGRVTFLTPWIAAV